MISSGEEAGQGQEDEVGRAQQQAGGRVALVLRTPAHITRGGNFNWENFYY